LRLALAELPTLLQIEAANSYARIATITNRLYITEQTSNVLKLRAQVFAAPILADTRALKKARYLRRWARRLKEFSFSPEDAVVLAYGSFGVDIQLQTVGVDPIITTDIRLADHYHERHSGIEDRFNDMISDLPEPYAGLGLPQVVTTARLLALA
jgi:hypothetical protein